MTWAMLYAAGARAKALVGVHGALFDDCERLLEDWADEWNELKENSNRTQSQMANQVSAPLSPP
eukprot:6916918-Pyramimonas_sp.AAC.1